MSTHNNHADHPDRPDYDQRHPDDERHRTNRDRHRTRAPAPSFPDAYAVGPHLVIDKTEWVPGRHPERHIGYDGQRGYAESYLRCIQCGAERQSEQGFPPECDEDA